MIENTASETFLDPVCPIILGGEILKFAMPAQFPLDEITNEDQRLVKGWLSVEVRDKQGDVVPISTLRKTLNTWMDRGGFITDMHSNRVIGKALRWYEAEHPEMKKAGIVLEYKIFKDYSIDDAVWEQIKSGKRKGLSFGGRSLTMPESKTADNGAITRTMKQVETYEAASVFDPANQHAFNFAVNFLAKSGAEISPEELKKAQEEEAKLVLDLAKGYAYEDMTKPFAGFKDFDDCISAQGERGHSEDSAKRICGWLQHRTEDKGEEKSKAFSGLQNCPNCGRNAARETVGSNGEHHIDCRECGYRGPVEKSKACPNCQGENARTGYVEDWDGICPDCGRKIRKGEKCGCSGKKKSTEKAEIIVSPPDKTKSLKGEGAKSNTGNVMAEEKIKAEGEDKKPEPDAEDKKPDVKPTEEEKKKADARLEAVEKSIAELSFAVKQLVEKSAAQAPPAPTGNAEKTDVAAVVKETLKAMGLEKVPPQRPETADLAKAAPVKKVGTAADMVEKAMTGKADMASVSREIRSRELQKVEERKAAIEGILSGGGAPHV